MKGVLESIVKEKSKQRKSHSTMQYVPYDTHVINIGYESILIQFNRFDSEGGVVM